MTDGPNVVDFEERRREMLSRVGAAPVVEDDPEFDQPVRRQFSRGELKNFGLQIGVIVATACGIDGDAEEVLAVIGDLSSCRSLALTEALDAAARGETYEDDLMESIRDNCMDLAGYAARSLARNMASGLTDSEMADMIEGLTRARFDGRASVVWHRARP